MLISVYTNYGWKEFWLAVMKKYLLGIDVGTTGTKTLLFRADGQLIGHAYEAYPLLTPQVGWSEQRAEDWWQAVVHTVRQVCEDPDVAKNVAGISLSLQGGTFVPTDAGGRALRPPSSGTTSARRKNAKRFCARSAPTRICIRRPAGIWVSAFWRRRSAG